MVRRRFSVQLPGQTLFGSAPVPGRVTGVFTDIRGWWDPTPSRGRVVERDYQHGGIPNEAYYSPRVLVLTGSLYGDDPLEVRDAFESFLGNLSINELFPIVVDEAGLVRHALVRLEEDPLIGWRGGEEATFNIQLIAPDYRRFAGDGTAPSRTATVGLPYTSGGRVRPYSLPSQIDAQVVAGSVNVVNSGSAPPVVIVTFHGPVPRPVVRSATTGDALMFDLEVLPGQSLVVDLGKRTALLNGVSRRGRKRGRWLTIPTEGDTLIFDAEAYDPDARMTVDQTEAWK